MFWAHDCFGEIHFKILEMGVTKNIPSGKIQKNFLQTSDQDLRDWKKKNYSDVSIIQAHHLTCKAPCVLHFNHVSQPLNLQRRPYGSQNRTKQQFCLRFDFVK